MKPRPWLVPLLLLSGLTLHTCPAPALDLYVATNGSDADAGTKDKPFASLERARDELRKLKAAGQLNGAATVQVRGGFYPLARPLALTAQDGGDANAPIVYRAAPGERVTLVGGQEITGFKPWRGEILQCDVKALGLDTLKPVSMDRYTGDVPGFELFFDGRRMDLARWPNHIAGHLRDGEWAYTAAVPQAGSLTQFNYFGDRPRNWARPAEAQVHIFAHWDWFDQYVGVKSIDAAKREITLATPTSYDLQPGRRYYVRNVFEELDAPGEWYLDRAAGVLYFWPPKPLAQGKVFVSRLENIVTLNGTRYVTLRGFTLEGCRGTAVTVVGGDHNRIAGCTIRNTGATAIAINGGTENGALGNDIYETGRGGISVSGGDRKTLVPAGNYADNNHIHHFGRVLKCYQSAVSANGVGNRLTHNLIHDAPHMAVGVSGNDHVVEFNEVYRVCLEGSDNGAFYTGRDWTFRGNEVRYNSIHDVYGYGFDKFDTAQGVIQYHSPHAAQGIYLDDAVSSFHVHGNVLYRVGDMMVQLGGGRDHVIENNIFVDGHPAIGVDNRWTKFWEGTILQERLKAMPYQTPPWSERYPELAKPMRNFKWPEGNKLRRNISATVTPRPGFVAFRYTIPSDAVEIDENLVWNGGQTVLITANFLDKEKPGNIPWDKWQATGFDRNGLDADPKFVDPAHDNYQLRDDSPAYQLGFERIPMEKIGLYQDELRASWPVPVPRPGGVIEKVVDTFPMPGWTPPPARNTAAFSVPRATAPLTIDGAVTPAEWGGLVPAKAMTLAQNIDASPAAPPSQAWLAWDDANLYVAVRNTVNAGQPLRPGATWGRDDAVEIALRNPAGSAAGQAAPIFVLRGYPNGHFESSPEAGAPETAVRAAGDAAKFAAKIIDAAHWDAEWQIPFAALGIDPARHTRFEFNLTARKTADDLWLMWRGTSGSSWQVDKAGTIALAR